MSKIQDLFCMWSFFCICFLHWKCMRNFLQNVNSNCPSFVCFRKPRTRTPRFLHLVSTRKFSCMNTIGIPPVLYSRQGVGLPCPGWGGGRERGYPYLGRGEGTGSGGIPQTWSGVASPVLLLIPPWWTNRKTLPLLILWVWGDTNEFILNHSNTLRKVQKICVIWGKSENTFTLLQWVFMRNRCF